MSYYSELLEDLSEGLEPRFGDCGDQEGDGFLNCAYTEGVAKLVLGGAVINNGVTHVAFAGAGDTQSAVEMEVVARGELIEPQWILPLCIYIE